MYILVKVNIDDNTRENMFANKKEKTLIKLLKGTNHFYDRKRNRWGKLRQNPVEEYFIEEIDELTDELCNFLIYKEEKKDDN